MELLGIKLAAQLANQLSTHSRSCPSDIAIFSDNQSVLNLIHDVPRASSGQHLIMNIRATFRALPNNPEVRFYWAPGHAGIELNEVADSLAKEAAANQTDSITLPSSLGSLTRQINSTFNVNRLLFKPGKNLYRTAPKEISKELLSMERGRAAAVFQLRTKHSPLNAHLFRRQLTDSPLCSHCRKIESTEHFLLYCSRFKKARQLFRNKLKAEEIKINWNNAKKLLDSPKVFFLLSDFILQTKRFVYFKSYVQEDGLKKGSRGGKKGTTRLFTK